MINKFRQAIDPKHKITNHGLAMLISQSDHESGGFKFIVENLNYKRDRLLQIFPKYFNQQNVDSYVGNPQRIANRVYADRMGNGSEQDGDGYKYRGRGYIQLTGFDNYKRCGDAIERDFITHPELLEEEECAIKSAVWFFVSRGILDNTDINVVTRKINGGTIGIEERKALYNTYLNVIGKQFSPCGDYDN